jgi:hypothetical protein
MLTSTLTAPCHKVYIEYDSDSDPYDAIDAFYEKEIDAMKLEAYERSLGLNDRTWSAPHFNCRIAC